MSHRIVFEHNVHSYGRLFSVIVISIVITGKYSLSKYSWIRLSIPLGHSQYHLEKKIDEDRFSCDLFMSLSRSIALHFLELFDDSVEK